MYKINDTYPALPPFLFLFRLSATCLSRTARAILLVLISLCSLTIPAQAEVSMTVGEFTFRYSSGTFKMSETYGPQLIDVEDVVVTSNQEEQFTADYLVLKATGTMQSLDWIEKIEVVNAQLISPASAGYEFELETAFLAAENIHLAQPETLGKLAERLDDDRNRPTYLKLTGFGLVIPNEGLIFEIDNFVADGNPDLINSQLPTGQHVTEARLENARLLPSGSGETSMMFRFMLSGLGLDALRLDGQASSLSRFRSGQFDSELRLDLDADALLGVNVVLGSSADEKLYQILHQAENGETPDMPDEQQAALLAGLFPKLSMSVKDGGALRIYDSLSSSFGLPDRRELALLTEYQLKDRLKGSASFLVFPIVDFIRAGGSLTLSARPSALTADDFSEDEDRFIQTMIDKAELNMEHTP